MADAKAAELKRQQEEADAARLGRPTPTGEKTIDVDMRARLGTLGVPGATTASTSPTVLSATRTARSCDASPQPR